MNDMKQLRPADDVESFITEVQWRYAKTMARWPHWYVMKWGTGDFERTVRYYYAGDYKYWVMDPTIEATDLINRARLDGKGPADGFEY